MTFEDMMQMKRLGETAVSKDGKWLAYSVTTVDLEKNTKTPELWLQKIEASSNENSAPFKIAVAQAGDSGPEFDPGGKRILFLSSREGGEQVWIADFDAETGAAANARKLTRISTEADKAIWSPDGKSIVFTSAVYPDCPAITTADFETGNKCNADRDAALKANPVKAQIFTHLLYRHWDHFTGDKRSHLFLVSVESGAMRDLNPGDTHDVPPFSLDDSSCGCAFAPDAKELAFTENPDPEPAISTSPQIYTLDLADTAAKPVKISTSAGGNFNPAYSPDGKYIAWRSQARAGYESDKFRLMAYDREKGGKSASQQASEPAVRDLLPKFENWVDEFAWATDSKAVFFVSSFHGESPIYAVLVDSSPNDALHDQVPFTVTGALGDLHPLADGQTLIVTRMSVREPSEVYLITMYPYKKTLSDEIVSVSDAHSGANYGEYGEYGKFGASMVPSMILEFSHLNEEFLAQLDLPKMESFRFNAVDGTKLEGFLIRPPGFDAAKKYPLKFLIHGGPQGAWGDDWSYRWNAELFAANGYVVVMINPRGSTGYGQAIVDGVNGDWGGKPFTDLMTGLDYAEAHYPFIDKTRECALGASYGGYMANWILGHTDRFKCIVSHDGMFDAESAFGTTEEDWFNIWEFKGHPWDYYGKPDSENPYRKWSPSLSAKNFKTPTLVVHGQLDYRLDVSEGFQLFDTLQLLGVPSKMLYFPDEGHWVLKPKNSQLWWKTVNDWVDEWTKSRD
jgi:dipeptidyl aminopeptidase/acylaminoacyl peptidase